MNISKKYPIRFSLRDIIFIFFYKIHIVIGVFVLVTTILIAYSFTLETKYKASASVLLKPFIDSRQQVFSSDRFKVDPVSQEDINTEIKILKSRELAQAVVARLGLSKRYVSKVRKGLDVSPEAMSYVIRISKTGDNPSEITEILNTYLECFIERHIEVHRSGSGVDFYKEWSELYRKKLVEAKEDLKNKEEAWGIVDIKKQKQENIKLLEILREKLSGLEGEIAQKKYIVSSVRTNITPDGQLSVMSGEFRSSGLLRELEKVYIPLLVEREKIVRLYPKNSFERKDSARQVAAVLYEINKTNRKILKGIEVDLVALEQRRDVIQKSMIELEERNRYLAAKEPEYEQIEMHLERLLYSYKLHLDKLEEARINEQRDLAGVANVSILSQAYKPSTPISLSKKIIWVVAVIAGFVAGVGAGGVGYYLDHTVKSEKDLYCLTGNPALSSMGIVKIVK
ncbi:hypothetical protein GKODMF_08320 [Candidatus Electrothrix gigas]